jgi:hypothetical protein
MADWVCKLYELAENLHRSDLEPREREAQTLLYASLKKPGLVEPADRKRSENAQNQYSAKPKEGQSHGETHPKPFKNETNAKDRANGTLVSTQGICVFCIGATRFQASVAERFTS